MVKSAMEAIYYENCGQMEKVEANRKYDKLTKEVGEYFDKLFAVLSDEQKTWLDCIWLLQGGLESEWGYINFCEGMRFGFWLSAELSGEEDDHIEDK